jgi:hypothetical protein
MKTTFKVCLPAACALASVLFVGCTGVSLPSAKGYTVRVDNTEYWAKSVKVHGNWIEMETESGIIWVNSGVTIKPVK